MRVAVRVDARLVRVALVRVALDAMGDQPGEADREEDEGDTGEGVSDDVPDPGHEVLGVERRPAIVWRGRRPAFEMDAVGLSGPRGPGPAILAAAHAARSRSTRRGGGV